VNDRPPAAGEPRTDFDDPALYEPVGMKPQCTYIVHWHSCRLDAGHSGKHSPGGEARATPPALDGLTRLRDRHFPVETQTIDDDGAGHPATLCGAHPWPVGWPCAEVVAIDAEYARLSTGDTE
jgi:hypothetical protein